MSDIAILKQIIKETATVPLENDSHGNKIVKLQEADLPNCFVTIRGIPDEDEIIVIKADQFKSPDTVFIGSKGECKRADFVIVADTHTKKVIVCIEMKAKRTTSKEWEIIQQLRGAQCFIAYCQKIGKEFWGQPKFLDSYVYRFVTIRNINIHKKTTRKKETEYHDSPERMLKISSPHYLQFNHLIE
ncbi:hypothetical protein VB620_16380 [Nodularia harveyana UHCC-0300]|uniref:Type I restriction enzyme R protein N-terminal domain-containing protein n=1 Tax=Nodularia harveyana UHCC-0300 TaxID=2974287 RepID=A0ABU5UHD1_9CYAN|nr:hypothetical protein [Nodularia harveyana]MEA5582914.1 hypothetical protein [Nodularia harveyana UHCC-0300]